MKTMMYTLCLVLGLCLASCASKTDKADTGDKTATEQTETTTTSKDKLKGLESLPKDKQAELLKKRQEAMTNKANNVVSGLSKRAEKLAEMFCKCADRKEADAKKTCEDGISKVLETMQSRFEESEKNTFTEAYKKAVEACK